MSEEKWLRQAADEIRKEGHYGWGNTCEQAADRIAELEAENARLREVNAYMWKSKYEALEQQLAELQEAYHDLIMQVSIKHPNETRHESAKRYIYNAEHQDNPPDSVTQLEQGGE